MKKYIYLLILTFFSSSVLAEGWYAGVGYLKSDQDIHNYPSLTYSINDSKDDGLTLFAGYDLNERFAIEAGYNDLGDGVVEADLGVSGDVKGTHEVKVMTLAGVIKTDPISENLVLFAKAGFARIDNEATLTGPLILTSTNSKKTTNPFYGIGANYELANGLAIRALYEAYGEDDGLTDINSNESDPDAVDPTALSISIIKRF
jgi:opacity protein-like surface antigen